jgi:hypothetical protein
MRDLIRMLLAGWGARKMSNGCMGGGCISFIVFFVILYWILGHMM